MRQQWAIWGALALLCTISYAKPSVKGATDQWASPAPNAWFDIVATVTTDKPLKAEGLKIKAEAEGLEARGAILPPPGANGLYPKKFKVRIPARTDLKVKPKLTVTGQDSDGKAVELSGTMTVYTETPRNDATATVTLKGDPVAGEPASIVVTLKVQDGLWVYGKDIGEDGIPVVGMLLPAWDAKAKRLWKAAPLTNPGGKKHVGEMKFEIPFTPLQAGTMKMRVFVSWQACDEMQCYNTEIRYLPIAFHVAKGSGVVNPDGAGGADGGASDNDTETVIGAGDGSDGADDDLANAGYLQLLLLAVGGALFALAMPCTYPMIPITISFFTKQAEARNGNTTGLAIAYGLGIIAVFMVAGVVIGEPIQQFAAQWWVNALFAALFLFFGLSLVGLYDIRLPSFMDSAAAKASGTGGYLSVFLMGTTLVITSFTCTAPIIGAVIVFAAKGGSIGKVAFTMAIFGLTMAIPFVFLSLSPKALQAMPRSGMWMKKLKVTLGIIELGLVLKFLSNVDLAIGTYYIGRETFLALWALSFLIAGVYLLELPALFSKASKWSLGKGQWFAAAFLLFATVYLGLGLNGTPLGDVLGQGTARRAIGDNIEAFLPILPDQHVIYRDGMLATVKEDYEKGLALAKEKNAPIFLHFTGFV